MKAPRLIGLLATLLLLVACSVSAVPRSGMNSHDRALESLAKQYWKIEMAAHPTWATGIGYPGHDHELDDISPQAVKNHYWAELHPIKLELKKIQRLSLSAPRRVTYDLLLENLNQHQRDLSCRYQLWRVNHMWGPQVFFLSLPETQEVKTRKQAEDYKVRLRKIPAWMDQHIENLRVGLSRGYTSPKAIVTRVDSQVDALLEKSVEESPLVAVVDGIPKGSWSPKRREKLRQELTQIVQEEIRPAFRKYQQLIKENLLPSAREEVGIHALPFGAVCYDKLISNHTTLTYDAEEIHEIGLAEMAKIRSEMQELIRGQFPGKRIDEVLPLLREDESYAFESREEIENKARTAVERAWEKLPEAFGNLPKTGCEVKPVEPYAEKHSPMAYYRGPSADGKRPGTYYVNTYDPKSRPRYEAEVLAFHEAVPGHHLQIALAKEIKDIPEFQKHVGVTAFVEGWGLYSERVSDELGLYSGPLDRMGMLSFDAWRAARLVVDTGMHALGWSRERAIDYMLANTASSRLNAENEIDRYIARPGQALAYKLGQRKIFELRHKAEAALGAGFDIREFHDRVLGQGAIPLPTLEREIETWVRSNGGDWPAN